MLTVAAEPAPTPADSAGLRGTLSAGPAASVVIACAGTALSVSATEPATATGTPAKSARGGTGARWT
ncbi:hypothetical protein R8Z57_05695 [Microbacterium sp. M3]|uniref:Uncharacterized protein n=1 Tax=Microbacterium arthrosphaerae TaxID=792652 RepID=A0ABU4GYW6_9MICO|nr:MULTISPECIES: hypothetical protein [Microbacterium]MDW4572271.1 hypothetical protein [Microbacterium arthrosphaerae]MDW7606126.1 hypothetical protein [Microbacterium sp. M3]